MIQGISAYNNLYSLFNISNRDLKNTSTSPARIATEMLFGKNLNKTYEQMIDYDTYNNQASFQEEFRAKLGNLRDNADALTDKDGEAFASRDAEYNSEAVTITVKDNADVSKYEIEVEQVATTQLNETEPVKADDATTLEDTLNHIEIQIGEEATDLLIEREAEQSNEELFTSIAESINSEELGVTAQVITNEAGQISLAIEGNELGEESNFEIRGNLAESLNIEGIDRLAQDAVIRVDNDIISSNSNLVELDGGLVGIQINSETTIPFHLQIEVSGKGALSVAKRFANSFNQAMVFLQGYNSVQLDLLGRQIERTFEENSESFEELGITKNAKDEIVIDEKQFELKFEKDESEAKKILTEFRRSVKKVEKRTTEALKMPVRVFTPTPKMPIKNKSYNLSYNQNMRQLPVNALFTKGSIIDVFF